ncbi:MAG: 2'-5' RNA ligase family protein [Chloroflexota bacterium]|nr:2'-5' RNA ligase family protein [Chloroflexota bacterium]
MSAIISELDENAAVQVMHLWRRLHRACGLEGIFNYPTPHFTWFSSADVDVDRCLLVIETFAKRHKPFQIQTAGLGLFPGELPVLFLPLVKSLKLATLHQTLWEEVYPLTEEMREISLPPYWVPHITLAIKDLNRQNLTCAVDAIAFDTLQLFIRIDNIMLVEPGVDELGDTMGRFSFSGEETSR